MHYIKRSIQIHVVQTQKYIPYIQPLILKDSFYNNLLSLSLANVDNPKLWYTTLTHLNE